MNRYKIALGKEPAISGLDPVLEYRLRNGAAAWMSDNSTLKAISGMDTLEKKALKAHMVASRLFPKDTLSDDCLKTAGDLMYLEEEKIDKVLNLLKSGK